MFRVVLKISGRNHALFLEVEVNTQQKLVRGGCIRVDLGGDVVVGVANAQPLQHIQLHHAYNRVFASEGSSQPDAVGDEELGIDVIIQGRTGHIFQQNGRLELQNR